MLRQRASSQPAAAAVTDAVLGRVAQLALETVQRAQRSIGSAQTMMMGDYRF